MKNLFKSAVVLAAAMSLGTINTNAFSEGRIIDKSACETVYTNYYLLLETNVESYFDNINPGSLVHENKGVFVNNVWRTDFDPNNIGYGEVLITTGTDTSANRLDTWSLRDFYNYMLLTEDSTNGNYIDGNNTYLFNHSYQKKNALGRWEEKGYGYNMNLRPFTTTQYIDATYNTTKNIKAESPINNTTNDFTIYIKRYNFANYAFRTAITVDGNKWLYDPAVYYVQYCKAKAAPTRTVEKYLTYDANTTDTVTNMPNKQSFNTSSVTLSSLVPVRTGYKFLGWTMTSIMGNSVIYGPSAIYSGSSDILYAQWEKVEEPKKDPVKNTYRIMYHGNATGVVNVPEDTVKYEDEDAKISSITPSLDGYEFLGWNTDPKASNGLNEYKANSSYTKRKDLNLYAIWKKKETPAPKEEEKKPVEEKKPDVVNPNTGIEDYILPVSGVSISSLIGLALLKKKRTFIKF